MHKLWFYCCQFVRLDILVRSTIYSYFPQIVSKFLTTFSQKLTICGNFYYSFITEDFLKIWQNWQSVDWQTVENNCNLCRTKNSFSIFSFSSNFPFYSIEREIPSNIIFEYREKKMSEEEKKEHDVPYKDGKSPFKPPLYLQRYNFANGFNFEKITFSQIFSDYKL